MFRLEYPFFHVQVPQLSFLILDEKNMVAAGNSFKKKPF